MHITIHASQHKLIVFFSTEATCSIQQLVVKEIADAVEEVIAELTEGLNMRYGEQRLISPLAFPLGVAWADDEDNSVLDTQSTPSSASSASSETDS